MSPTSTAVADVFRQYVRLYELRNNQGGELEPSLENEWKEVSFTLDSIFSGMYQATPGETKTRLPRASSIRNLLPVHYLRVPVETDVLCETPSRFFSGKLQDISTGGAYVHSAVELEARSVVRLTFCTFRDRMPLELEGRVAWANPKGTKKKTLPEGAGVQFLNFEADSRRRLDDYVYELVEETLVRANLI